MIILFQLYLMSKFNVNIVNIYAKSVEFSSRTSILVTRQASPFSGWSFGSIWWVHWLRCMFFPVDGRIVVSSGPKISLDEINFS